MSSDSTALLSRLVPVAYAGLAFLREYREHLMLSYCVLDADGLAIPGTAGPEEQKHIDEVQAQVHGFEQVLTAYRQGAPRQ